MRYALALLLTSTLSAAEIPQGAHCLLRLVNSISSRTAREGDYIYMRTDSPIVSGGAVLVPVDSYVQGVVTSSKRPGRVKGTAELSIRIESLTLPSGKVIKIAPHLNSVDSDGTDQQVRENDIKQGASKGADAAKIATTGGAGAAIGGLADRSWKGAGIGGGAGAAVGLATVLLTRGREVELKRGSTVDVVFERAVPVE